MYNGNHHAAEAGGKDLPKPGAKGSEKPPASPSPESTDSSGDKPQAPVKK